MDISKQKKKTPLTIAFTRGNQESVALFLGAGASVDYDVLAMLAFGHYNLIKKSKEEMIDFV